MCRVLALQDLCVDIIQSEVDRGVSGGGTFEWGLLPAAGELLWKYLFAIIINMWASVRGSQLTMIFRLKIYQGEHTSREPLKLASVDRERHAIIVSCPVEGSPTFRRGVEYRRGG